MSNSNDYLADILYVSVCSNKNKLDFYKFQTTKQLIKINTFGLYQADVWHVTIPVVTQLVQNRNDNRDKYSLSADDAIVPKCSMIQSLHNLLSVIPLTHTRSFHTHLILPYIRAVCINTAKGARTHTQTHTHSHTHTNTHTHTQTHLVLLSL